jgi:hypothetical protein
VANLDIKQDAQRIRICRQLDDDLRHAQRRTEEQQEQTELLIDKMDLEIDLLENLYQQVDRTGDREGFASDITDKQDEIRNLRRKIERARGLARQWESQAAILEREMFANGCGNFA